MAHSSEHADHSSHILPIRVYLIVYFLLLILLFVTVGAALIHIPIPGVGIAIALTIAVVKMLLVILYFMHVKFQSRLTWLWASVGFAWLVLLLTVVTDYVARPYDPHTPGWVAPSAAASHGSSGEHGGAAH